MCGCTNNANSKFNFKIFLWQKANYLTLDIISKYYLICVYLMKLHTFLHYHNFKIVKILLFKKKLLSGFFAFYDF